MAGKSFNKLGWKQRVVTKTVGGKVELECMDNEYWIKPKKLSIDAMQQIMAYNKIELSDEELKSEDIDKIEEKVKEKISQSKTNAWDKNLIEMMKVAFINGVHDHNFDEPVYQLDDKRNVKTDKKGEPLVVTDDAGNPVMRKCEWNEELYDQMKDFSSAVFEIYSIVMQFNRPPKKKKSGK